MTQKVVFLGMGGTIAGRAESASDNVGYKAGQVSVEDLLGSVPGLQEVVRGRDVITEQVAQIDSADIGFEHWGPLVQRVEHYLQQPEVRGIVITHGTDTIEETAYLLMRVLPAGLISRKAVVLTCAMRPASSIAPDGPGNLRDAAIVALCDTASGVMVVCGGRIHSALHVRKIHPYRLDPFDSGEVSPLGFVEEGKVRLTLSWRAADSENLPVLNKLQWSRDLPWVEIVSSHAAAGGGIVRALCNDPGTAERRIDGIVVAGTGNGTIHSALLEALLAAQKQGVRVVRVTRCELGQIVSPKDADGGVLLSSFDTWGLSPVKARLELALRLMTSA